MKFIKISDAAKKELNEATMITSPNFPGYEGELKLNQGIKNYAELKKIFAEIGVEWNKKAKTHYVKPGGFERINEILAGGQIVDEKKTLQAFYTPLELVEQVVEMADVEGKTCLEPSCGDGRMVEAMLDAGAKSVMGIELNLLGCGIDQNKCVKLGAKGGNIIFGDFLTFSPTQKLQFGGLKFQRVLMNPPYDRNTWVKHIEHAWGFLENDGKLVAICPNNESNKFLQKFLEGKRYEVTEVEAGAFKESGTMIKTMILEVWK